MCRRWRKSAAAFARDVGPRPGKEFSIERIDNDGNYEPGNVKWATRIDQNNNKRNNRTITFEGETLTIAQMARKFKMSPEVLCSRLKYGWSMKRALTKKIFRKSKHKK